MRLFVTALLPLVFIFAPQTLFASDGQSGCLVCHNVLAGNVNDSRGAIGLNVDQKRFQESVHGFLGCTDCHIRFSENPHAAPGENVYPPISSIAQKVESKARTDAVAMAACANCHGGIYESVLGSVHGQNVAKNGDGDGALCIDCHGSPHYINPIAKDTASPARRENVVETCGKCHADDELTDKYGINHNVMKSYRESFHGKKFSLGHSKAPTCVNCHGYHNVLRSDDPQSPIFGSNKLETCGECHTGANEKFVAAITHKEPGPIPHVSEIVLIILTMSVFAFIVLHVILEAYSDIRDTFFRRQKEVADERTH